MAKGSGSAVDIPSKREAHLDTLIYMCKYTFESTHHRNTNHLLTQITNIVQAMAHPNFQKRYMPWDAEAAAEFRPQKDEVFGKPKSSDTANVDNAEGSSQKETLDETVKPEDVEGADTGVPEGGGVTEEGDQSTESQEKDAVEAAEPSDKPANASTTDGTAEPAEENNQEKEETLESASDAKDKDAGADSEKEKADDISEDPRRGSADSGISLSEFLLHNYFFSALNGNIFAYAVWLLDSPTAEGIFTSLDDELSKAFGDQDMEKFAADGKLNLVKTSFSVHYFVILLFSLFSAYFFSFI